MASRRRIRVVVTALDQFVESIIKRLVLDIVANLVASPEDGFGTPVDTGWARANWIPQIGVKRTTPVGTYAAARAGDVNTAVQQKGLATVAGQYRLRSGPVFISNSVRYIVKLNDGSSLQSPSGFVQNAITKAVQVDLPAGFGL